MSDKNEARSATLEQLGENEALRLAIGRLSAGQHVLVGPGDDAAMVATSDDRFVVTTDTMIEGFDFRLDWSSGFDLGFKAVATNLADIAAMGAEPTALVVALAVPGHTEISWLEDFADGLQAACAALAPGVAVVGGDLAAAAQVFIAVTAHGRLNGRQPVQRSGARPGDTLAVAGTLGHAAAGLALLRTGDARAIAAYDEWVAVQLRPQPPIASGVAAALAGASAMLDLSDGLVRDAHRVARASDVLIEIERGLLAGYVARLEEPAMRLGADPLDWVLAGGEDHSLLATFGPGVVLPRGFKAIGRVSQSHGNPAVRLDGVALAQAGWDSVRSATTR